MSPANAKNWVSKAIDAMGVTIGQKIVTGLTLTLLTFMATTGKGMVRSVYAQETKSVMQPEIKTLQTQIDNLKTESQATGLKVDSVAQTTAKVDEKMNALISILVDAFPQVKTAAQDRTKKNKDSQDVQDALTGEVK